MKIFLFFPHLKEYSASLGEIFILAGVAQIICILAGTSYDWALYKILLGSIIGTFIGFYIGKAFEYIFDLASE